MCGSRPLAMPCCSPAPLSPTLPLFLHAAGHALLLTCAPLSNPPSSLLLFSLSMNSAGWPKAAVHHQQRRWRVLWPQDRCLARGRTGAAAPNSDDPARRSAARTWPWAPVGRPHGSDTAHARTPRDPDFTGALQFAVPGAGRVAAAAGHHPSRRPGLGGAHARDPHRTLRRPLAVLAVAPPGARHSHGAAGWARARLKGVNTGVGRGREHGHGRGHWRDGSANPFCRRPFAADPLPLTLCR